MARAKLNDGGGRLDEVKIIFRQDGPLSSGNHYGCRIVQANDGNLFVTLGEHFSYRNEAQNLGNHLGKLIRITPDGAAPPDNPFIGRDGAKPEIWSYGHRNEQGLAINPASGDLWEIEHGPRGGDSCPSAVTMRMRPGRSVTSILPSGKNASAQGCTRPVATVCTSSCPAEDANVVSWPRVPVAIRNVAVSRIAAVSAIVTSPTGVFIMVRSRCRAPRVVV